MRGFKFSIFALGAMVATSRANYPPPSSPPTEDIGGAGAPPTVFVSTPAFPSFPDGVACQCDPPSRRI